MGAIIGHPLSGKRALIIRLAQKGNLTKCKNWQNITLPSIVGKVLVRISIDRISCGKGKQVLRREEEQPNKLVFILQNIFEQVYKWEATLYLNFIDFEKAIDSIYRESPLDHHEGV